MVFSQSAVKGNFKRRPMTSKIFAYGSNLDTQKLKDTLKTENSFIIEGTATIQNKDIAFNKLSSIDKSGKANLIDKNNSFVIGIIYSIQNESLPKLDKSEGGYKKIKVTVKNINDTFESVDTYVAKKEIPDLMPTKEYLDHIVKGANEHNFPDDYIEKLKSYKTRN